MSYAEYVVRPLETPSFEELYAQIEALPEGVTGEILEQGIVRAMPRPGQPHQTAAKLASFALRDVDAEVGGRGWWILIERELRLLEDFLAVPDLCGFRCDRVPKIPRDNPIMTVPDWCCEILSSNGARDDRRLKLPLYARTGVGWTWLVDPEGRLVEVYETVAGRPALAATAKDDDRVKLPPFEDVEVTLGPWWLGDA